MKPKVYDAPTTSSPIAMSRDGRLVWSVNPGGDNVVVIRTDTNRVIRRISVGDEPQSVALDPDNRYAYVANAAAGTVTVIRIRNASPNDFNAAVDGRVGAKGAIRTGAEPWNVVTSPNGRRIFVANSAQDTITVLDRGGPPNVIGHVNLRSSTCNGQDRTRHFQPRGLAVTKDNTKLYVTSFLAWVRPGGRHAEDTGKEGVVCRLDISTNSRRISRYRPAERTAIQPRVTGFTVDSTGDGVEDPTSAFPNQLQSIVIRGGSAYLPNIAASPDGPLRFNVSTQAFVNVVGGVRTGDQTDASAAKFLNLHLGAREPEAGKKKLFFANVWAMAFTNQSGAGSAYVVSAGSDLLVKVNVSANGTLAFTGDQNTTRYIDLNDPRNPATSGQNAGKNPQGIVINRQGTRAYVQNFVSRNVSVVSLSQDRVVKVIRTAPPPPPGSQEEINTVGAEMFFSSRGHFDPVPASPTASLDERLSSDGWQSCSSCHFKGLTDGVVWEFGSGPRKSVPLNASFNPNDPNDQRILNYSGIFDEIEDFDTNVRNTSGPGPLAAAIPCQFPPPATSTLDPAHGLIIADNGLADVAACVINSFARPNADRPQVTVTLPGSNRAVPAFSAMREWVKFAIRTPNGPLTRNRVKGGVDPNEVNQGRALFVQAGCVGCHGGPKWTISTKNFASPPTDIATETTPAPATGNPVGVQFLPAFLRDIGSFNLGVPGGGNDFGPNIGAFEKAPANLVMGVSQAPQDALGFDYNRDGKGSGYNVPSLLGIWQVPPYYHNGACETLQCVLANPKHRTANGTLPDRLPQASQQAAVVAFLRSIEKNTPPTR